MKTPPPTAPDEFRNLLEATYTLQVRSMHFIPRGECSWGYRVEGSDGRVYFLKLFRGSSFPAWVARLTDRLRVDGRIENISCPLPARSGMLLTDLCGYPAALFDFIEGPTLFQVPSKAEILFHLGELLARIHACQEFREDCQRVEPFDIVGSEAYDQVIAALNSRNTQPCVAGDAAGEARRLLQPVCKRLEALMEEILLFQEKARKAPSVYCICHGDPTPGNILVSAGGKPYLIDWDDMILAPPERDLVFWEKDQVFFAGQPSYPVLAGYRRVAGDIRLNPDITGFYHRQWTIGEIAEYGHRLLFENHTAQQNESDLDNLKEELNWI